MCRLSLMTDLALKPDVAARRAQVRAFMEEHVYPNEAALAREDESSDALIAELRAKAKAAGIWAPHLPPDAGGSGSGFMEYALLNEEIGRSVWAQLVFNCQAPDAGNGEILHLFGTDEQKERFLRPLVEGTARSFFSMAETDPDAPPHRRMSQIIVPTDTPGYELIRPIPVMGHAGRGWSTHCEVRYTGVRVPRQNILGEPGDGFRIAQKRLGPGRIHHVMRWLGQMQRAFELMCSYSLEREAFGSRLADKQTIQNWIADSAAGIHACRLMTLDAARKIDDGDEARVEVSVIKFFAAQVLHDVIDRAIQVHGARGLTDETPLAGMYANARAARIYDGPDEVHRMVVSRRILKEFEKGGTWRFS